MPLDLPAELIEQIIRHAQSGHPEEACGLVSGKAGRPVAVHPGRNVSPTPRVAFEMDTETLALQIAFEEAGLELLAIYHSHPQGPEEPSETDLANATYPDAACIIVSFANKQEPRIRAYRLNQGLGA